MKVLNLTSLEDSEIKYIISKFPDGQQNITISEFTDFHYTIKSRLNNFQDLELIICTVKALRELGAKGIHLFTPYFLGSRSDRKFEIGSCNYLKDVICPIINSLNLDSVTTLDPHSDVLEACINRFKKESNFKLVKFALNHLDIKYKSDAISSKSVTKDIILISPDGGALKKIYKVQDYLKTQNCNLDIITCSKDRDNHGKLTKTIVPNKFSSIDKDIIIIDDICDGGATFINIAKEFKDYISETKSKSKIYLIVTHGIFSKGFGELQQYFDSIYTTNSYKQLNPDIQDFVKQFNVF